MAWNAERKRRHWYCINGWNAILWYDEFLYDQWWNSLTDEEICEILHISVHTYDNSFKRICRNKNIYLIKNL